MDPLRASPHIEVVRVTSVGREVLSEYLMSECMALKGGQTGLWEDSLHILT